MKSSNQVWELIEENDLFEHDKVINTEHINYLKGNYRDLELGKKDLSLERRRIRDSNKDFYLFHHINDVPFDECGRLLETDEAIRLTNSLIPCRENAFLLRNRHCKEERRIWNRILHTIIF